MQVTIDFVKMRDHGEIVKKGEEHYHIRIRKSDHPRTQLCTLIHELIHFALWVYLPVGPQRKEHKVVYKIEQFARRIVDWYWSGK